MKKILISTLAAATLLGSVGLATAHDGSMRHGQRGPGGFGPGFDFAAADADSNGKVTQAEIEALAQTRFEAADTDGNGSLSAEELTAQSQAQKAERAAQRRAAMVERMDQNGDGELSFDEMQAARTATPMDRMFQRLDTDSDGALSEAELDAAKERFAERGGKRGEPGGKRPHRMGDGR